MPIKEFREYDPKKVKHEIAEQHYYQEYLPGSSFQTEVMANKSEDLQANFKLIATWFRKKFSQTKKELDAAKTQDEINACQDKMIAYHKIMTENARDFFYEDCERKEPGSSKYTRYSSNKEITDCIWEDVTTFRVYDMGLDVFATQVDRNEAQKRLDEAKQKAIEDRENAIKDSVDNEKSVYRADITPLYQTMQKEYNEAFEANVSVSRYTLFASHNESANLLAQTEHLSITDMVKECNDTFLAEKKAALAQVGESIRAPKEKMENLLLTRPGVEKFDKNMAQYSKALSAASAENNKAVQELAGTQVAIYMATKNRMDRRSGLSKFFHPFRTRKENAMFAKMRDDLKNTLGVDETYMKNVDSYIEKNDTTFATVPEQSKKVSASRIDYGGMIASQAEMFGKQTLADQLAKDTELQKLGRNANQTKTAPKQEAALNKPTGAPTQNATVE